jgi:hypothetical protein
VISDLFLTARLGRPERARAYELPSNSERPQRPLLFVSQRPSSSIVPRYHNRLCAAVAVLEQTSRPPRAGGFRELVPVLGASYHSTISLRRSSMLK